MKERPILFSAPMVRALLEGTKTQTRRIVQGLDAEFFADEEGDLTVQFSETGHGGAGWYFASNEYADEGSQFARCPYGAPGDRLWVRETFSTEPDTFYRATCDPFDARLVEEEGRWRPSIFMRRHQSRITLEVTGVRVERLQDISEEDARAEGVQRERFWDEEDHREHTVDPSYAPPMSSYAGAFEVLWDRINGERAPWKSNPWVWVVDFKRVVNG